MIIMPEDIGNNEFMVDSTDYWGKPKGVETIVNVHLPEKCVGRPCVMHDPSDHHMIEWPLLWRADKGTFERTCTHGIGHPDPDDDAYQISLGDRWIGIHTCDGCCHA